MRTEIIVTLLLATTATPIAAEGPPADRLDWLLGCWEDADGSAMEVWVKEASGDLMAFGMASHQGEVVFFELIRIEVDADLTPISYTAYPYGREPTTFRAEEVGEASIVVRNPQHDYPQEITYRREGEELVATTSLLGGDRLRTFDKRRCD